MPKKIPGVPGAGPRRIKPEVKSLKKMCLKVVDTFRNSSEGVKLVLPEPDSFVDWDPRLPPPGNIVERQYKGKMIRVIVLQEGFEYEGRRYKSLTAIAKEVSGSHCNGFLFFRLGRRA